ncbi:MAG TPA: hypothetical protein PL187_10970 [Caldilinea sp.]|nr:hypothetical protein [Caldilinea sp.]
MRLALRLFKVPGVMLGTFFVSNMTRSRWSGWSCQQAHRAALTARQARDRTIRALHWAMRPLRHWINLLDLRQRIGKLVAKKKPTALWQLMAEKAIELVKQIAQDRPTQVHCQRRCKGQHYASHNVPTHVSGCYTLIY